MCGIVGVRRFDGGEADPELLRRMCRRLAHRGPDAEGILVRGHVGFGHRRLSIIDLERSAQPMSSPDGRRHVCFNGEILNYADLRAALKYPYRTSGDTEVLLALHERRGSRGVEQLRGQFAYALFDEDSDELWLVRDRVGILPLFYYADSHLLAFASEIKALLPALPGGPAVDEDSLADYLTSRSVPAPWTLFRGVRKLPAGHMLRVTAKGVGMAHPYWSIEQDCPPAQSQMTPSDAVQRLSDTLSDAVSLNLVADVPVGAYLSGGLDSSLLVALAARIRGSEALETFSAGFGDRRFDELPFARQVSGLLGTRHHEVHVRSADFEELWEPLTWHRDAPISEASDVAVYRLAQLARESVKVVLSGEGSDELFAGYPKYRYAGITSAVGVVPAVARSGVLDRLERVLPAQAGRLRIAVRALAAPSEADRFATWFAAFTPREAHYLLRRRPAGHPKTHSTWSGDSLRRMLAGDVTGWLADNLLERGDRMSMATSLEVRPPFLDQNVVALAFAMPSALKVRSGVLKWPVKQVAARLLPNEIVHRRKVGFRVPLDAWFRSGLGQMAADRLLDPQSFVASVLDQRLVARLLSDHQRGRRNEERPIWTLLSLEIWHEVFFRDLAVRCR